MLVDCTITIVPLKDEESDLVEWEKVSLIVNETEKYMKQFFPFDTYNFEICFDFQDDEKSQPKVTLYVKKADFSKVDTLVAQLWNGELMKRINADFVEPFQAIIKSV